MATKNSETEKTLQNGQEDFDELETHSLKLQRRVVELIRHLHFDKNTSKPALLKALAYYQTHDSTLDKNAPVAFLEENEREALNSSDGKIAESCRRLIKNAIVCWNYLYLTRELANEKNEERKADLLAAIRNGSVVTWAHFNLHGEFDFSDEKMADSVGLVSPKKKG